MSNVILKDENIDNITKLWLPDKELCTAQEELRRIEEWKRNNKGIRRPSELGINNYRYGNLLHSKFFEGRTPPPVPLDSAENLEWYEEQLKRSIFGFEYNGTRITGDHYFFLNFTPFMVSKKDEFGTPTSDFILDYPSFAYQQDYIFKLIEEAHALGKGFMLMGSRGFGKTYMVLSILVKTYFLKPESDNVVSASQPKHAEEAFEKLKRMMLALETSHPTMALARLTDTKTKVISGYEINIDGKKQERGPMSMMQQLVYGDNPDLTRGRRLDTQLLEEVGAWSGGKGDLKSCIGGSIGSWRVGSINKTRVFLTGTGGSVTSDQARSVFTNPAAYNLLAVNDFALEEGKQHCVFIPAQYLYGGAGWERTGVNNNEWSEKVIKEERILKETDPELYNKFVQEFPFTLEEAFKKSGTNIFHTRNIAKQLMDINFGASHIPKVERGFLEWKHSAENKIVGVAWVLNPEGNIEIIEHPYRGKEGRTNYPDLYVSGIDSIDQGQLDSTTNRQRSSLAMLVKKRIVDGEYFKHTSNLYVAKYIGRSLDVRDDYEEALKLTMYYGARINVEHTKIGIVQYFREKKQWHMFMKRPMIAKSSAGSGDPIYIQRLREQTLIGTTATPTVIDYGDGKIKEYTRDFCNFIYFKDVLDQLLDYQREDRRRYDLVIAMALCEIADEDMLGQPASPSGIETAEFKPFGYFTGPDGKLKRGILPVDHSNIATTFLEEKSNGFRWIDMSGAPRFDANFDVADARDLELDKNYL